MRFTRSRVLRGYACMPREEVVKGRFQVGKEGCVPSQSNSTINRGYSIYVGPNQVRYIVGGQKN